MSSPADELNTFTDIAIVEEEGFDTLRLFDQGDAVALAQVADDGQLHDLVIGIDQARELHELLGQMLEDK